MEQFMGNSKNKRESTEKPTKYKPQLQKSMRHTEPQTGTAKPSENEYGPKYTREGRFGPHRGRSETKGQQLTR